MWTVLSSRRNTSSTAVGRQAIYRQFCSLRPTPGEQIGDYFAKLLELQNQISGTPEAISDVVFKTHVFASLPAAFEVTAKIQQNRPNATIKSILDSLKEDESIRGMCVQPDASTEAFFSHTNSSNHQRGRGLGRFNFLNHPNQKGQWCTFCNTLTHNRLIADQSNLLLELNVIRRIPQQPLKRLDLFVGTVQRMDIVSLNAQSNVEVMKHVPRV